MKSRIPTVDLDIGAYVAARMQTVQVPPPSDPEPPKREGLRGVLREMRPSVATRGAAVAPLLILAGLNAADELDKLAFNVLVPEIRDYFGISLSTVIGLSGLTTLIAILLVIPIGFLSDRWSRVQMTAVGAATWGLCTVLTGLAPSLLILAVARFGSGLGKTLEPAHKSLLADYYEPEARVSVFAVHGLGNPLGKMFAPIVGGLLASAFIWQVPFLVFAVPTFVLAALCLLKMREPVRGEADRRAQGASEEVALAAETPPGFAESWRIVTNVRTLRRLAIGLPLVIGPLLPLGGLVFTLLDDKFGLSAAQRGLVAGLDEPFAFLGIVIGIGYASRLMRFRPGRVVTYLGLCIAFAGVTLLLTAVTPWLPAVVVFGWARAFLLAVVAPASAAVLATVVPAKVRGFSVALMAIAVAIGIAPAIFAGGLADRFGVESGIVALSAVFMIGAAVMASAGSFVEPDMRAAAAAAMASHVAKQAKDEGGAKLLVCRDLDVSYGNVQILFGVDFEVTEGEIIALLGTNGAGKSTLLRAISGLTTPGNGAIVFDGEDITYLPAYEHAAKGIIQLAGGCGVFPTLSVAENLRLAAWMYRDDDEYVKQGVDRVLGYFPILRDRYNEAAGNMSGGEQQMLNLSQAFLSRPRLLMIDELSLGLAPAIIEQLLDVVREIHAQGTTIILVEQSVNVALTVAERAVFMEKGAVQFSGPTAELMERTDILRSVFLKGAGAVSLGSSSAPAKRRDGDAPKAVVLEARNLVKAFGGVRAINGIGFTLEENSILGFIGPNGAGKTTLYDLISGYLDAESGQVLLFGDDLTELGPDARARLGLQRSFQDARLFPSLTVAENISVALERHIEVRNPVLSALHLPNARKSEARVKRRVDRLIDLNGIGDFRDKFVRELSTGSRRIVDLACILAADPKVILLDEPSSGVAQKETEELGPLLQRIRYETGCAMLIIEHDMPLITSVADELVALELGTVLLRGRPDAVVSDPRVVTSYLGTSEEVIQRSGHRT